MEVIKRQITRCWKSIMSDYYRFGIATFGDIESDIADVKL
jgi:hypothetical protein